MRIGWSICLPPIEIPQVEEKDNRDATWFSDQTAALIKQVRQTIQDFLPWLLPEFAALHSDVTLAPMLNCDSFALAQLPECIEQLRIKLEVSISLGMDGRELRKELLSRLPAARHNSLRLIEQLRSIAMQCERLVRDMDFAFLLDQRRKLLSIGYDVENQKVHAACYDLLASEARIAAFISIAKGDIPQESWFQMSRSHVVVDGQPVLISWTGTMFEYLMPQLWMRSYPATMLENSKAVSGAGAADLRRRKRHSMGCLRVRLRQGGRQRRLRLSRLRRSPACLAAGGRAAGGRSLRNHARAGIDPAEAIKNLRWMKKKGWFGTYGFYEAADFTRDVRPSRRQRFALVKSWMVHHQGMSLLAIANLLNGGIVQKWFRMDARVQATELLLQERPAGRVAAKPQKKRTAKTQARKTRPTLVAKA